MRPIRLDKFAGRRFLRKLSHEQDTAGIAESGQQSAKGFGCWCWGLSCSRGAWSGRTPDVAGPAQPELALFGQVAGGRGSRRQRRVVAHLQRSGAEPADRDRLRAEPFAPGVGLPRAAKRARARRRRAAPTRNEDGEMVPLGALASISYTQGCGHDLALNPYPTVGLNGASAPSQLGRGDGADGPGGGGPAAGERRLCLDRHVLPGADRRQPGDPHLRAVDPPGLPGPRRPLRELDQPHGGDPGRAARLLGVVGGMLARSWPTTCTAKSASS